MMFVDGYVAFIVIYLKMVVVHKQFPYIIEAIIALVELGVVPKNIRTSATISK